MDKESIALNLELELSGETLTGRARNGSGQGRDFAGWLGLLGAIDALIAEKTASRGASGEAGTGAESRALRRTGENSGAPRTRRTVEAADPPHSSRPKEC